MTPDDIKSILDVSEPQSDPFSPQAQEAQLLQTKAEELHRRLNDCPPTTGWQEYQDICADILEFALRDCLVDSSATKEFRTWDDVQRMDIIMINNPKRTVGFWRDRHQEGTEFLIFECKDYANGIGPQQVLQAKGYEISGGEKFRVILTREMPKQNAINAIRHWSIYLKVKILVLTDAEMHKLIDAALMGAEEVDKVFYYAISSQDRRSWYYGV